MESNEDFQYTILSAIKEPGIVNLFGIVKYASEIRVSIKSDFFINVSLVDDSMPLNEIDFSKIKCIIFSKSREPLNSITQGCLMRFHRMKFKIYSKELRGENSTAGFAWSVYKTEPNSDYNPIEISSKTFTPLSVQSTKQVERLRSWFVSNREKILDESDSYKEARGYNIKQDNKSNVIEINGKTNSISNDNTKIDEKNIFVASNLPSNSILGITDDRTNKNFDNAIYPPLEDIRAFTKGITKMQFVSKYEECSTIANHEEFINTNKRCCSLMSSDECDFNSMNKKLRKDLHKNDIVEAETNMALPDSEHTEKRLNLLNMANEATTSVKICGIDQNNAENSQIQLDDSNLSQFTSIEDSTLDKSFWCLKCLLDVKPPFIGCTKAYLVDIVPSLKFPNHLIKLKCLQCEEAYLLPKNFKDESFLLTNNLDYLFPAFIENYYYCPRCSTSIKLVPLEFTFMYRLIFNNSGQLFSCNQWEIKNSYFFDISPKDILENSTKGLQCINYLKDIIQKRFCLNIGLKAFKSLSSEDSVYFKLYKTKLIY